MRNETSDSAESISESGESADVLAPDPEVEAEDEPCPLNEERGLRPKTLPKLWFDELDELVVREERLLLFKLLSTPRDDAEVVEVSTSSLTMIECEA